MGREIKRVALDFDWPISARWKGYLNPYRPHECRSCNQTGLNPASQAIAETFYPHQCGGDRTRAWHDKITQDEVQALVDAGRLMDFTHEHVPGSGWRPKDPAVVPTAEEVNALNRGGRAGLMGHDGINRMILVEARARRLGVYGTCIVCGGSGEIWCDPKFEKLHDEWESIEPPAGEGWQVWETVSEGSPVTPVFATAAELVEHLVAGGDAWDRKRGASGWSRKDAEAFVRRGGAPTMLGAGGELYMPSDLAKFEDATGQEGGGS